MVEEDGKVNDGGVVVLQQTITHLFLAALRNKGTFLGTQAGKQLGRSSH